MKIRKILTNSLTYLVLIDIAVVGFIVWSLTLEDEAEDQVLLSKEDKRMNKQLHKELQNILKSSPPDNGSPF
jgi:hypothetical protein